MIISDFIKIMKENNEQSEGKQQLGQNISLQRQGNFIFNMQRASADI